MHRRVLLIIGILLTFIVSGALIFTKTFGFYPSIGYVEIKGIISEPSSTVRWIKTLREEKSVRAILVKINSPGGSVVASNEIYNALRKASEEGKPVVAYLGNVAASGGYYIACAADRIVASPGSVTGSIGVIMEFPVIEKLMKKLGVEVEVIKSREYKDIGSPFRKMKKEERKLLKDVILDVYDQFVQVVCESRGLPKDSVLKIADGRILTGRQAFHYGLADTIGTEEDAIEIAKSLAGIKGKAKLLFKKKRRGLIDILFGFEEGIEKYWGLQYRMEELP